MQGLLYTLFLLLFASLFAAWPLTARVRTSFALGALLHSRLWSAHCRTKKRAFPTPVCASSRTGTPANLFGLGMFAKRAWAFFLLLLLPVRAQTTDYLVATEAGGMTIGLVDGVGTNAGFSSPLGDIPGIEGLATNGSYVFVADAGNHAVRIVTRTGAVQRLAGDGTQGFVNGVGAAARFNLPSGVAVLGSSGLLYVADTGNNAVRSINAFGAVATVAGDLDAGYEDSTNGTLARFSGPSGMCLDEVGINLYVADTGNHAVRRVVAASGAVYTLAGSLGGAPYGLPGAVNGQGTNAAFRSPRACVVGTTAFFIADTGNHMLRSVSPGGL